MQVSLGLAMALIVAMATKHLVADFFLQTSGIAKGKAAAHGWLLPLAIHAGGHAAITLGVILVLAPRLWWVAVAEFIVHAVIDRGKVLVSRRTRVDMASPAFWWLFGLDQYLHQVTNIAIVAVILLHVA